MTDEPDILGALRRIDERTEKIAADLEQTRASMAAMRTDMIVIYHIWEVVEERLKRMEAGLDRLPRQAI